MKIQIKREYCVYETFDFHHVRGIKNRWTFHVDVKMKNVKKTRQSDACCLRAWSICKYKIKCKSDKLTVYSITKTTPIDRSPSTHTNTARQMFKALYTKTRRD